MEVLSQTSCVWKVVPQNPTLRKHLARELKISEVLAQILINRGITNIDTAREFLLAGTDKLLEPYLLKDMRKAVARVRRAIANGEKIVIYGDYDVDGITATSLMYLVFKALGADVHYYIPERFSEGYGLNHGALQQICDAGAKLIITVDCGISAVNEVETVKNRIDIIVTDHHEPGDILPNAYAILNPKQPGCSYPCKNLAGVGVAFKLCQALWQEYRKPSEELFQYIDLVAIGTIADIVPLTGENRIIAKEGLARIAQTANRGLRALLHVSGLENIRINSGHIGFGIGPRINASGRVNRALSAVELFTTNDENRAKELARQLEAENIERRRIEDEIRQEVEKKLQEHNLKEEKVLVISGEGWHHGVIGIVASRIVEKHYRPTLLISIEDGVGKGSCRSIRGFHMFKALSKCSDILIKFGGHAAAAGFSIVPENIPELKKRLNQIAEESLSIQDLQPVIEIDIPVELSDVTPSFVSELNRLAPYGEGNPAPVLACRDVIVTDVLAMGQEGKHLKLKVRHRQCRGEVVLWNRGDLALSLPVNSVIALTFFPEVRTWQERTTIQLRAGDIKRHKPRQL